MHFLCCFFLIFCRFSQASHVTLFSCSKGFKLLLKSSSKYCCCIKRWEFSRIITSMTSAEPGGWRRVHFSDSYFVSNILTYDFGSRVLKRFPKSPNSTKIARSDEKSLAARWRLLPRKDYHITGADLEIHGLEPKSSIMFRNGGGAYVCVHLRRND